MARLQDLIAIGSLEPVIIAGIIVAFAFTFINGFHDGCNVIATVITSRSIKPWTTLAIACAAEFTGPLVLGTAVASTIGKGIIDTSYFNGVSYKLSAYVLISALFGGIAWNIITWVAGLPSSSSHALIGGLIGSSVAAFGMDSIKWISLLLKVILVMVGTPFIGFIAGYLLMKFISMLSKNARISINKFFKAAQVFSVFFLGASHGANDAQKGMGIIVMFLIIGNAQNDFFVPFWTAIGCAVSITFGLSLGGWRIIKTIGMKIFRVKPIHSFNAQLSAGLIIFISGILGGPVSTSQVVSSSITGVGTRERINAVRWAVAKNIFISWIITIPCSALLSGLIFLGFDLLNLTT